MSACTPPIVERSVSRFRWTICALLFFATTINYVDRQVLSILAPDLQKSIGWSEVGYAKIVSAFQGAYAIGLLCAGRLVDRIGTRRGFPLIMALWSIAAMLHAVVGSAAGFAMARGLLGLGEAGNFPVAVKTVSEWFPKQERALATGIFNAGANVGAIAAPLLVPWIALRWGWRWAFVVTGAMGFVWLLLWRLFHVSLPPMSHISAAELARNQDEQRQTEKRPSWRELISFRQTWAIALARFLTDPVWWFFLFWLPKMLNSQFGVTLSGMGPPLLAVYLAADIGSVGGGSISSFLIRKGWPAPTARRGAMMVCAVCVAPVFLAARTTDIWMAVGLIGLAAAAHQGWSANLYTLVSDLFPSQVVGAVVGIAGFCGAIGGILLSTLAGHLLQGTNDFQPILILAAVAYLVALSGVQYLAHAHFASKHKINRAA